MSLNIIEYPLLNNRCYHDGRWLKPVKGLMLHSVGCSQPAAKVFADSENRSTAGAAVHAILQPDGTVYKTLPWDKRGWHAGCAYSGGPSANDTHIGVEMSEPAGIRYTGGATWVYTNEAAAKEHIAGTYKVAVELFAMLCEKFNLDPLKDGVIISHAEGYKRGIACGHADVEHIWNKVGLTMDQFRKDVANHMAGTPTAENTIKILYASLLGRVPDASGLKSWSEMYSQKGFEACWNGIAESVEGRRYFVKQMYRDMLFREASKKEIDAWAKYSRIDIYNGIVNSAEYKSKH